MSKPILFNGDMVRALLDGRKTQTRRVVKWQGPRDFPHDFNHAEVDNPAGVKRLLVPCRHPDEEQHSDPWWHGGHRHYCPFGDPGDLLWVRETWCYATDTFAVVVGAGYKADGATVMDLNLPLDTIHDGAKVYNGHHDDWPKNVKRWRPSIHMPRWASRITLRITDVRVERLQDITSDEARAEGVRWDSSGWKDYNNPERRKSSAAQSFRTLWESTGGDWNDNPWVWVIAFEVIRQNIDEVQP